MDKYSTSVLLLLDLSAAFDTIDHCILLRLNHNSGVSGLTLSWLKAYLHKEHSVSAIILLHINSLMLNGVPQGLVLGPQIFSLFCLLA